MPEELVRFLSILASLVIVFINIFLKTIVRKFSLYEKQDTLTAYNMSVAFKLTIARFVNSAVVPVVVNVSVNDWFNDGGLVTVAFYVVLSVSFVDPFLTLVDPFIIIRYVRRIIEKCRGNKSSMT